MRPGLMEILIILGIALLLFGAGRLADIGKGLGEGIRNFKKGIKDEDKAEDEAEQLPAADAREFVPFVAESVLKTRQPDGSFWDYPTYDYHKYYGTGYALIALSRCPPAPPSSQ